jgi:hypothetical protein
MAMDVSNSNTVQYILRMSFIGNHYQNEKLHFNHHSNLLLSYDGGKLLQENNQTKTKRMPISKLSLKERFELFIYYSIDGCWYWVGGIARGYGMFSNIKGIKAHRMSYILFKGEIADGLYVCHSCDNKLCVNPDHLFLGTHQDNLNDMTKKNRRIKTHCNKGHLLTPENSIISYDKRRNNKPARRCKICFKTWKPKPQTI